MKPHRSSIRRKLSAAILLTSAAVLVITCSTFAVFEFLGFRQQLVRRLGTQAAILAANSTAALAFRNDADAREILSSLAADPHAVAACLYDDAGRVFATYPEDAAPATFPVVGPAPSHRFEDAGFVLFEPVIHGGDRLGTLYLESDLLALHQQFRRQALVAVVVAAGSALVAFALAVSLRRRILQPILGLAQTARRISEQKDYSVRAPRAAEDETGQLTEAFNEMLDEIERRDESLRRLNEELEARVRERTAELEASNGEMEAFSYSVSHDLRAPLRAIDGFSKALVDDYGERLDSEGHGYLGRIRAAAGRMANLIDDLLRFSRTSRAEIRRERVDLGACASRIADELRQADPRRAPAVSFVIPGGLVVEGDGQLLCVVLDNLLRNAWKFTAKHATARIELGSVERDGSPAYFVRDDGVGFDMAHAKLLFRAFQRLHRPTEFEGTGIGLALSHRIIERHSGRLWAEAAVEDGATFYFTLWEGKT
jgi:signal transduction histidine kinase